MPDVSQAEVGAAVTDPTAPQSPKSRRSKKREPQTIDLSATVVDEDTAMETEKMPEEKPADEPVDTVEAPSPQPEDDLRADLDKVEDSPEISTPPPPADRKTSAFSGKAAVTGLVFGLIGGVAGAALMLTMQPPTASVPPQMDERIAALETQLKTAQPDSAATLAPRIGSVETAAREAAERIDTLEAAQQALATSVQTAAAKVDALAQATPADGNETPAVPQEFEQRMEAFDQRFDKALGDVQASIGAIQTRVEEEQRTLTPLGGRIEALEKQTAAIANQAVDPMPAVRYALAMRLEQAVATGKPFAATLAALRKTGVSEAATADIAVFAGSGAPTTAQLKAEFKEPAQAMIGYERSQSGDGFTDKLLRMSERVVRIRPRENPQSNDLSSMVVRIEAALDRGSFAEAAELWNSLPDAAKQLSAAWGKRANDRANAAAALAKIADGAVSDLEGSVR